MKILVVKILLIFTMLFSYNSLSAEGVPLGENESEAKDLTKAVSVNDDINYFGDKVSFSVHTDADIPGINNPCKLPAGETFRALGLNEDKDIILYTNTENIKCVKMDDKGIIQNTDIIIPQKMAFVVNKKDTKAMTRYGLTYGALLVPYKYYADSETFEAASSVGPYMGYRFDSNSNWFGLGGKLVGFLGATTVDVPKDSGGSSNVTGVSYGIGFIGIIKDEFQFGLTIGADKVSKSENFDNDGKTWIALAIGYNFTN